MAAEKQPETTAPQAEKPPTGESAANAKPALGEDDEFEDFPSEGTLPIFYHDRLRSSTCTHGMYMEGDGSGWTSADAVGNTMRHNG